MRKMPLDATKFKAHPAVEQLRTQALAYSREPYAAPFRQTAVDSSGNQGLADDLIIYAGATDIMRVNFAERASELPMRAHDPKPTREQVYDRGTEAWCALAEFCRAGQVRGLPQDVVAALTSRRFASNMVRDASGMKRPAGVHFPLRLEDQEEFTKRSGRSPDEADACAMAALLSKERCGFLPFGFVVNLPRPEAATQTALESAQKLQTSAPPRDAYEKAFDDALQDMNEIRTMLKRRMMSIYHVRIAYPVVK